MFLVHADNYNMFFIQV